MTSDQKIRNLLEITQKAQAVIAQANALLWVELTKPKAKPRTRAKTGSNGLTPKRK